MKKRFLTLALCAVMLLSSLPLVPLSFGTEITASAANVATLQSIYDQIPKKDQWNQFIDSTQLAKFYDDATAILASPNSYNQNNVDMTATNLKAAWDAIRYHTTDILVSPASVNAGAGETVTLTATLRPDKAGDPVQWITNAPEVATVTGSGENNATATVKVLKYSAAAVTITAVSNGKNASSTLHIGNPIGGIRLSSTSLNVFKGQTVTLEATPYGADQSAAMSDAVTSTLWTTSNASVATVSDNGLVSAVGEGYATIKVTMIAGGKTLEAAGIPDPDLLRHRQQSDACDRFEAPDHRGGRRPALVGRRVRHGARQHFAGKRQRQGAELDLVRSGCGRCFRRHIVRQ